MTDAFIRHGEARSATPVRYDACGLDGIFLINGFERATQSGDEFLIVNDQEDLHRAIAEHLAVHRKVLAPKEIKFIREALDYTQKGLADELGTTDQTVARWEKGHCEMPGPAERLLRILAIIARYPPEKLQSWILGLKSTLEAMDDANAGVFFDRSEAANDGSHRWCERQKEAA